MNELNNVPSAEGDRRNKSKPTSSPWRMLSAMLLLIAGLLLTGMLLIHYMLDKTNLDGTGKFNLAGLADKVKSASAATLLQMEVEGKKLTQTDSATDGPVANDAGSESKPAPGNSRKSVRWPKLKLTGFGKSSVAKEGFAIINDQHQLLNQEIDGVKVVEIRTHDIVVEYKGERKTLTIDH